MFFLRFEELSKSRNLSVNAVASILGLSSGSVTAWKKGTIPCIFTLKKLADYFEVSIEYIFGFSDIPKNTAPKSKEEAAECLLRFIVNRAGSEEERQKLIGFADIFLDKHD